MKYIHWAVQGYHIKKYEKSQGKGFTVRLCPTCNKAWESHYKDIMILLDFPKRGLKEKVCKFCKKK